MYTIGIDLGGTNIAGGIVDADYKIIRKISEKTNSHKGAETIVNTICSICNRLIAEEGVEPLEISYIGIATPGIADNATGTVEYSCNLPFVRYPLARKVSEGTGIEKVYIANDANAAAWGEAVAGAAKGARNSVMVTLGTGVGGGIIIDGKIYSGFNNSGGEIGHIVIEAGGEPCNCGRRGCWESYSSATALIRMTKEKLDECKAQGRDTCMEKMVQDLGHVSGRTAFDAKRMGDAAGTEVVEKYLSYLAQGLVNIINIFQPEVLSIGGGVSNEGEWILDAMSPTIKKEQYGGGIVAETQLRIAKLGNDAGIIGAATLGMVI